jgi:hypothetical protein
MSSKKVCSSLVLLLSMFSWSQLSSSASAREHKRTCSTEIGYIRSGGEPIYRYGFLVVGRTPVRSREVNVERCIEEDSLAIGAIAGFGNNRIDPGVAVRTRLLGGSFRSLALFREKGTDLAGALTYEIGLGPVDLFVGGGYNHNTFKSSGYPYATTGLDIKIAPKIDLNATVRIPINTNGSTNNSTDYFVGTNLYF